MKLSTSRKEYLKVTHILKNNKGTVRSIDIAQHMGISRPSACVVAKQLEGQGYIKKGPVGLIELTDSGKAEAELVFEMHCSFGRVFMDAGIFHEQAHIDTGRPEHAINEESFEASKEAGLLHELEQDK